MTLPLTCIWSTKIVACSSTTLIERGLLAGWMGRQGMLNFFSRTFSFQLGSKRWKKKAIALLPSTSHHLPIWFSLPRCLLAAFCQVEVLFYRSYINYRTEDGFLICHSRADLDLCTCVPEGRLYELVCQYTARFPLPWIRLQQGFQYACWTCSSPLHTDPENWKSKISSTV